MENTVKIPTFLYEIHGRQSNWFDIIITHLSGFLIVIAVLNLTIDLEISSWKKWILIGLAYDLGSGLATHFTYSTKEYYQNKKRRIIFLAIHFLHPLFMVWVFPEHTVEIGIFSGIILFLAFIVDAIPPEKKQVTVAVIFVYISTIALHNISTEWDLTLLLLLHLYLLKLLFSFSVKWNSLRKIDN